MIFDRRLQRLAQFFWQLSESESESELLYGWRFTANQFVLATSPLRLTTCNFFFSWTLAVIVLCNILSEERMSVVYNCAGPRQRSHSQIRVGLETSLYSVEADPYKTPSLNKSSNLGSCSGIAFTELLPSNGRLLWLHCSRFQASCHNIIQMIRPCKV
jgi:hypothetical protein